MSAEGIVGWDRLRHGGLLLDAQRQKYLSENSPVPLMSYEEMELRRQTNLILEGVGEASAFVGHVLQQTCGFTELNGQWLRGTHVPPEWGRPGFVGETIKPRQLWIGKNKGVLPVFFDPEKRVGVGRGRKSASQVLQWLRSGKERLALLTNGHQWRLIFAGLDFDAWCEWDIDLWFEEGAASPQVSALRHLLQPAFWDSAEPDATPLLLQAVLDSRKGQAELSAALGERVREAVEILVRGHGEALKQECKDVAPADIYRAAVRIVMRMVVVLFAESRESLLPLENQVYFGSYGLDGLLGELEKIGARGGNRLARSWNAWPRVLALFRLVQMGSHHPALPVTAYGGELFAPGDKNSTDGLSRALAVFEGACFDHEILSDRDVHQMLERITRTKIKVRQGRSSTMVAAPVDFSDISSEYIGILYEGLLDFELKNVPVNEPVIFLAVGNQPALPLSRLEDMDDKAISNLLEKMKDTSKAGDDEAEDEPEELSAKEEVEEAEEPDDEDIPAEEPVDDGQDERRTIRTRAEKWARKAVEVGKLVKKPAGSQTSEKRLVYQEKIAQKARQIIARVILPGEWFLVRWGGTRKGAGTFYTRPGLAVPTVHRTLRPLAFDPPIGEDNKPDNMAPAVKWTAKKPEEILALKICDPACGSGTFPVSALRFLTDSVYASLHHHRRITQDGDCSLVKLLSGDEKKWKSTEERIGEELLPCRPDDPLFEPRLKAVLKRHVVERCIYGVDLDPLAVELCRISLWLETMDRNLPFSFIDHKIRCGNALVGAWFDQFQHYPVMAWKNREGGDKGHSNGVHFEQNARTQLIKKFVKEKLSPDLINGITGQLKLGDKAVLKPTEVHDAALAKLSKLHEMPVQDSAERARIYREELIGSKEWQSLKSAMDAWCACWFWPADEIDKAPLPTTMSAPVGDTLERISRIAGEKHFFHWELEFPDVFSKTDSGFDAVLGNPPWNISKPNSKEFFSNVDPLYRSYGKQEALSFQKVYFEKADIEREWIDYNSDFRALSNFMKFSCFPFGDPQNEDVADGFAIVRGVQNETLHGVWRRARAASKGYADSSHPFSHQGSGDINLYKMFLETAHGLIRVGGRLGFIVPSGVYSDHGSGDLRKLLLDQCRWEWLFGFENRDGIFEIHKSFKFNPLIVEKGGKTQAILTAFMRRKLEDWERAEEIGMPYARAQVDRFSPKTKAILEIQSVRDLGILEKIYSNSVLLGDEESEGWGVKFSTEFHMTNDSKLFPPRPKWEAEGYRPDEYSRWIKGPWRSIKELLTKLKMKQLPIGEQRCSQPIYETLPIPRTDVPAGIVFSRDASHWISEEEIEDIALPLYEGRMIGQFDFSQKGWVSGKGRTAVWRDIDWDNKIIDPQYLMKEKTLLASEKWSSNPKVAYMRISSSTNSRTTISAYLRGVPAGDSVFFFNPNDGSTQTACITSGIFSSFVFDIVIRQRLGGLNMSEFVMAEAALPKRISGILGFVTKLLLSLSMGDRIFAREWLVLAKFRDSNLTWRKQWALTPHRRLEQLASFNAIISCWYGLTTKELDGAFIDCDWQRGIDTSIFNTKGFWRVDKDKDPELRLTILTLVAFYDLEEKIRTFDGNREKGIETFLDQNNGEGWIIPETLRLADYGFGHDDRAKEHQPVASRLGPRFYDWQLAQTPEESWKECQLHARNMLGEAGYKQLLADIEAEKRGEKRRETPKAEVPKKSYKVPINIDQQPLF